MQNRRIAREQRKLEIHLSERIPSKKTVHSIFGVRRVRTGSGEAIGGGSGKMENKGNSKSVSAREFGPKRLHTQLWEYGECVRGAGGAIGGGSGKK